MSCFFSSKLRNRSLEFWDIFQDRFAAEYVSAAYAAPLVSVGDLIGGKNLPLAAAYRLQYNGKDDFKRQAIRLGVMDDVKVGAFAFF